AALIFLFFEATPFFAIAVAAPIVLIIYYAYKINLERINQAQLHVTQLNELYHSTVESLAMAIDAKDAKTHGHIQRVQTLTLRLAKHCGMTDGNELEGNDVQGNLCIKYPWPSIIRTMYGDHERCRSTYFSTYPGKYFTGDGCKRDQDGYYRITGRVDDVINVSGHRLGTAEVEAAIDEHPKVMEAAVVGYPHDIKGQGIYAYAIMEKDVELGDDTRVEILDIVTKMIGPIAKPDKIQFVSGLPKTRSGKIMRRILRKIADGDTSNLGDTSTLLDPNVVEEIKEGALNLK
ncbi:MAG: AMP-binding protein, partial [Bacteroidetes bacterium]|nr:AMP-binding protein [Bacteroidota bacterium]